MKKLVKLRNRQERTHKGTLDRNDWFAGDSFVKMAKHPSRNKALKTNLTDEERFEMIIEETEEYLRNIYGDPDIESLPNKLTSDR